MIMYFSGIDGSGKSTIINNLTKRYFKDREVKIIWARYCPKLFSFIISFLKKKKIKENRNYNDMSKESYSIWKSFKQRILKHKILNDFLYIIQFIEYYFEYYFQTKNLMKAEKNNNSIIILDRYFLDFIVNQTINYGDISKKLVTNYMIKKMLSFDYILYLKVKPEIAIKRKKDIPSIEYLQDRTDVYDFYTQKLQNLYVVDANKNISEVLYEIKDILQF